MVFLKTSSTPVYNCYLNSSANVFYVYLFGVHSMLIYLFDFWNFGFSEITKWNLLEYIQYSKLDENFMV